MNAFVLSAALAVLAATRPVEVSERWDGMVADEGATTVVVPADFIVDAKTFASLWKAWRPDEPVPSIDFARHLVLVGVVPGPNRVLLEPVVDEKGRVTFVVGGTKRGGPGFGYALVKISRAHVISVNGKPIGAADDAGGRKVKIVGIVHAGRIAVGGETTGVTITTDEGEFELDSRAEPALAKRLAELDGKRATVEGRLMIRAGVEVGRRRIVEVTRIDPAG
jgi:hypothetical protein